MRAALTGLAVVLVAAGCSGGGSHEPKPYSAADLAWIKRLDRWTDRYFEQSQKIQPVYERLLRRRGDLQPLRDVLRPYRECAQTLQASVIEPEHERLRRAYELVLEACEEDRRLAREVVESASRGYLTSDLIQRSDSIFRRATQEIEDGLIANRPLPVRGGESDESRIEPRLTQASSALTLQDIEVRCWSLRDWSPMHKELNAYSGARGDDAGFVTTGFAFGASRVHIHPGFCEPLAMFLYGHWRPANDADLEELAEAVGVVAHETEHLFETAAGEAETECHAAQDVRRLARLLGASSSYASRLAAVYWRDVYPSQQSEYRSKECRNGGRFDRHPETGVFP